MSSPANDELATVLLKRYECLNALINHPQAKPELVDTLDMPRSNFDDVVRELEQADAEFVQRWRLVFNTVRPVSLSCTPQLP